jgi:ATP-binding cassette, subfamily G (WHITE), member 2, SNQ2
LATLYQAGENIYEHFDKVLVLDRGREVYFGNIQNARGYFEGLGFIAAEGQTTAEFLSSVTDPSSRSAKPGSVAASINSEDELAAAFVKSEEYKTLQREIDEYRELATTKDLPPGTSYNLSYPRQIIACLGREYQLAQRQRRVYYVKWLTTIILCLTCGSVYFDITNNAQGVFTRGGILYFALIFNGWLQFPELFDAYTNRAVLERQARLHLYRPSAVALARFLIDLPLIAFQHVVFILPFYFLTRLQVDAGKFFFFYLTLFLSTVNFSNLLRMFAYYLETLDDCFRYGGFSCTVLLLFAGFLIPAKDMKPYFGWLHWINPMYYGFENLFLNELGGLQIGCDGIGLVPASGAGIIPQNQICAVPGAVQGQSTVSGASYASAYGFESAHRWRNIGIMIAIAVAYLFAGVLGSELMSFGAAGGSPISYVKRSSAKQRYDEKNSDEEKSAAISSSSASVESLTRPGPGAIALSWKDLAVQIGEKQILHGITGYVKRGELTALCGASGAGKTTLLSHLSQINYTGTLSGEILFEKKRPGAHFRKITGFAQQNDLHDGTATVREAFHFSALLRQPSIYSKQEKLAHAEAVLDLLDLRSVADALIGDEQTGLSLEQKRRVTIGVELAARPEILFADEPTSGLDSQGALHIIRYLRALSHAGQAIIVTVHQPSALMFSHFDNLLALSSDGHQLYFGKANSALGYFEQHGASSPPGANPAEFILETVGAGISPTSRQFDWSSKWKSSPEATSLAKEIVVNQKEIPSDVDLEAPVSHYNSSTLLQIWLLTNRMLKNQWRNTPYVYSKIWVHVISAILVGFTFYKTGTSPQDLQDR